MTSKSEDYRRRIRLKRLEGTELLPSSALYTEQFCSARRGGIGHQNQNYTHGNILGQDQKDSEIMYIVDECEVGASINVSMALTETETEKMHAQKKRRK